WNLPALKALCELLGLAPGEAQLITQGDQGPVTRMQARITELLERVVMAQHAMQQGIVFWGKHLLDESASNCQRPALDRLKAFLEHLQAFNSPGNLKNFRYDVQEVKSHEGGLKALKEFESLQDLVRDF